MIDPLASRDHRARRRLGLDLGLGLGATVTATPVAFAAFLHRGPLQGGDRAHAVGHLPAPARRSIWARISSI